jgi:hypothetical protein
MRRLLLCLLLVGGPASAFAGDGAKGSGAPADAPAPVTEGTKTNAEGDYGGVQPGQPKKAEPTKKSKKAAPKKGTLSWIGFEAKEGGSQVFFQSAAPFEVRQRVDKGMLIVSLSGVTRLGGNTWRHVDTRFFETPISKIVAKKKGKGVEVRISFKNAKDAAQASMRTATEADGLYYAYLSFSGTGTPAESSGGAVTTPKDVEK